MAGGWYVLLEREMPGVAPATDSGKALLYYQRHLDELAVQLDLPRLSAFFCPERSELVAYLREQGVTPGEVDLPSEDWFDAATGLETVRGLLDRLRADPGEMPQVAKIIADLEELERVLAPAAEGGVRFHLSRKLPSCHA